MTSSLPFAVLATSEDVNIKLNTGRLGSPPQVQEDNGLLAFYIAANRGSPPQSSAPPSVIGHVVPTMKQTFLPPDVRVRSQLNGQVTTKIENESISSNSSATLRNHSGLDI